MLTQLDRRHHGTTRGEVLPEAIIALGRKVHRTDTQPELKGLSSDVTTKMMTFKMNFFNSEISFLGGFW